MLLCRVFTYCGHEHQFALKAKCKEERSDLPVSRKHSGRKASSAQETQHLVNQVELDGCLRDMGSGRGLRAIGSLGLRLWKGSVGQEGPWVPAPSLGRSQRRSSPQRCVIPKVWAQGGVSGGAEARRPREGGCARSRLCRRNGRNRWCSHSARSCTAAHAGSALGTRLCLEVGMTGVDLAEGARSAQPH